MIRKDRLVKLTQKLVQINSVNPPGNEYALSQLIQKEMRDLGLAVKIYSFASYRPNVVATLKGTWPRAHARREAILMTPHFDTVPLGKGWKYPPLGGIIKNGKIYGRGATDDKGNLASCMEVMQSLVEDKIRLKRDVILAATVDEETGSHYGILPLLDRKILRPKVALILDSDEFDTIIVQKGLIHGRIQIFGKKAHGAYNWRGINAIELAAQVMTRLKKMHLPYKRHPLLRGPTLNIGVIHGGDKVNMVPDFCEFAFDFRYVPGMNPQLILRNMKEIIQNEVKRFKIIVDAQQDPYAIDSNHPFVRTYVQTVRRLRQRASVKGSEGATVITFFKKHGIPALATGFGARGMAHTNDEYIRIETLYKGTQILEQFFKDYDALNIISPGRAG